MSNLQFFVAQKNMSHLLFLLLLLLGFLLVLLLFCFVWWRETCFDIIIIGAGTAGCILARRIHDVCPKKRILLLERGKSRKNDSVVYNVAKAAKAGFEEPWSEVWQSTDKFPVTVAKMVGGASSHNFFLAVHGTEAFYETKWMPTMGPFDVRGYLKELEAFQGGRCENGFKACHQCDSKPKTGRGTIPWWQNPEDHSKLAISQLPVSVNILPKLVPYAVRWAQRPSLRRPFQSLDVLFNHGPLRADERFSNHLASSLSFSSNAPIVDDYNVVNGGCVSKTPQIFVDDITGLRFTTEELLPSGSSVTLKTCASVERFDPTSLTVFSTCQKWQAKERIIVCAGGVYSPFLLSRSGIPVPTRMLNHYGTTLIFEVKKPHCSPVSCVPAPSACSSHCSVSCPTHPPCVDFHCSASPPFPSPFSSGPLAFVSRDKTTNRRDWQLVSLSGKDNLNKALIPNFREDAFYVQFLVWLMSPRSEGSIVVGTAAQPTVSFNIFSDGDLTDPLSDLSSLTAAMRWMKQIVDELSLSYTTELVFPPLASFASDAVLSSDVKKGVSITSHYAGTLSTVLNYDTFSVNSFPNVHVVDTSVFPALSDGNTEYPVGVLALIAADRIVGL